MTPPRQLTIALQAATQYGDDVKEYAFSIDPTFAFLPGQYVTLRFPGEKRYHAFSIASSTNERGTLRLLIKAVGEFTKRLFNAPLGSTLELLGPLGTFTIPADENEVVMIGGGVGVAPFLGVVRTACDAKLTRKCTLFYSCRQCVEIACKDELDELPAKSANVAVVVTLTRETPQGWAGELGRVDASMLQRRLGSLDGKTFYLCGPEAMVAGVRESLKGAGVPAARVRFEAWG